METLRRLLSPVDHSSATVLVLANYLSYIPCLAADTVVVDVARLLAYVHYIMGIYAQHHSGRTKI